MSTLAELSHLKEPERAQAALPAFALWQLGFRPFYLLASIFASLSIALWGAQYAGWLSAPYLHGPLWHAHEMVFPAKNYPRSARVERPSMQEILKTIDEPVSRPRDVGAAANCPGGVCGGPELR